MIILDAGGSGPLELDCDGDSRMGADINGVQRDVNDVATQFRDQMRASVAPGSSRVNIAVPGSWGGHSGYAVGPASSCLYVILTGINGYDGVAPGLGGVDQTGLATFNLIDSKIAEVRAAGIKRCVVCTDYITYNAEVLDGNARIRAKSASVGAANWAAVAELTDLDYLDDTLFPTDHTHPNPLACGLIAARILKAALSRLP